MDRKRRYSYGWGGETAIVDVVKVRVFGGAPDAPRVNKNFNHGVSDAPWSKIYLIAVLSMTSLYSNTLGIFNFAFALSPSKI